MIRFAIKAEKIICTVKDYMDKIVNEMPERGKTWIAGTLLLIVGYNMIAFATAIEQNLGLLRAMAWFIQCPFLCILIKFISDRMDFGDLGDEEYDNVLVGKSDDEWDKGDFKGLF